jgi:hypothetical protein
MFDHRIEDGQELAHGGDESDLLALAGPQESEVEPANDGVETRGDQRGHVQSAAHGGPSAPDVSGAREGAAVAVERGDPDQGGDLPASELAELRELGNEGGGGGGPDARI